MNQLFLLGMPCSDLADPRFLLHVINICLQVSDFQHFLLLLSDTEVFLILATSYETDCSTSLGLRWPMWVELQW
jgi:hypothetical protein